MSTMDKKKPKGNNTTSTTELINFRFYENQKRQALTTTLEDDDEILEGASDIPLSEDGTVASITTTTGSIKQPSEICDTGDAAESNLPLLKVGSFSGNENTCDENTSNKLASTSEQSSSSAGATSTSSDKSRKGSVDKRIWKLVNLINKEKDSFFTTSSCSGRIILYTWEKTDAAVEISRQKKGCKWLLISHDEIEPEELVRSYVQLDGNSNVEAEDVYFKMEPCILHVQCRTLTNAKKLVHIATESGFRNSGMVIGKENRITVAVRSAMGLEVPFPVESKIINEEYLKYLAEVANAKMRENWSRNEKLTGLFSSTNWS